MPINCSTSVLSGKDGSIAFKFAGTDICLLDKSDFLTGTNIINALRADHDFREGDPVQFTPSTRGTGNYTILGNLDSGLVAGAVYYIGSIDSQGRPRIVNGSGAAVTFSGSGGVPTLPLSGPIASTSGLVGGTLYTNGTYTGVPLTGGNGTGAIATIVVSGNAVTTVTRTNNGVGYEVGDVLSAARASLFGALTDGVAAVEFTVTVATITATNQDTPKGDISMSYAEFGAVCNVRSFSVELSRADLDSTSLPCGVSQGNRQKYAPFQSSEPGYVTGSGTMEVYFTSDRYAVASRLRENALLKKQDGAQVQLFVDTIANTAGTAPDLDLSQLIEAPIRIMGFNATVDPGQNTTATMQFKIVSLPTRLLTLDLDGNP
jgi:hypothetical protein